MEELVVEKSCSTFVENIPTDVTKEDFKALVYGKITDEDREVFGEDCEEQISEMILSLSVFAEYPSTMDITSVGYVLDIEEKISTKTEYFVNRAVELGVIHSDGNDRVYILKETKKKLLPIFVQLDSYR